MIIEFLKTVSFGDYIIQKPKWQYDENEKQHYSQRVDQQRFCNMTVEQRNHRPRGSTGWAGELSEIFKQANEMQMTHRG